MKKYVGLIAFLTLLLVLIIVTYKHYGVPWDEKIFFSVGRYYASSSLNFFQLKNNLSLSGFTPTEYHLKGHGVFYDVFIVFSTLFYKNFSLEKLHLTRALFAVPIFAGVFFITSYFSKPIYGLFSLLLLLFFPRFYSDIFTNAVDVPSALFFTLSVAYFIYFVKSKQGLLKQILLGVILGLAISQRIIFFYLLALDFFFLFLLLPVKKQKLAGFLVKTALISITALVIIHLTHPHLLKKPLTGIFDLLAYSKNYPWNASVLFDGQFYQAGTKPLPWYYLAKSMIITIPLVTLSLFLIGQINLIGQIGKIQNQSKKYLYFYLLSVFYIPFLIVFATKPTLYDSWRHFLFLAIPIVVIAALGASWIFKVRIVFIKAIMIIAVIIGLILTARAMIRLHPLEYLYYNSLVGGLKGAYGKYETDYWGLGYKEAVLWFNKNVNNPKRQYKIFVEGDPLSSSYYFKSNMQLTDDLTKADYIFTFTRWNFHVRHPGETVYTIRREGIPLIFIKKLKNETGKD